MESLVEEYFITWEMFAKYFTHKKFIKYYIQTDIISGVFHLIMSFDAKVDITFKKNISSCDSIS